jgi:adenylate kinase
MNILMLGPQGSGKGTQGKKLSKELDIPHISTGDMLREYVKQDTDKAREIQRIMDEGELIDDDFLEEILEERLAEDDCADGFILDGTPRDLYQAKMLEKVIPIHHAFLIEISEKESFSRISKRAEIEGREDDTPEALKERLHTYHEKTEPVLEHYKEMGVLHRIDGMQPIEKVFSDILAILRN